MSDTDQNIPESLLQAATEIAEICRKHNLRVCEATLHPNFREGFHDTVTLRWNQGRHGADAGVASLEYKRHIRVEVKAT